MRGPNIESLVCFHPVLYPNQNKRYRAWHVSAFCFQDIIQNIHVHSHIKHNGITLQYIKNDMDKMPLQGHRTHQQNIFYYLRLSVLYAPSLVNTFFPKPECSLIKMPLHLK
jgi:hypothetical protein